MSAAFGRDDQSPCRSALALRDAGSQRVDWLFNRPSRETPTSDADEPPYPADEARGEITTGLNEPAASQQ